MVNEDRNRDARPFFRRLAGGVAVVCFILAAIFGLAPIEGDLRAAVYSCLAVGVIMAGIALTGNWPWWGSKS
jgi:hypothetical protein